MKNDDLISRSALIEGLQKGTIITDDIYGLGIMSGVDYAIGLVNDAPSVDAVEVVRCKACIHQRITDGFYACHKFMGENVSIITNPNNYCSSGRSLKNGLSDNH